MFDQTCCQAPLSARKEAMDSSYVPFMQEGELIFFCHPLHGQQRRLADVHGDYENWFSVTLPLRAAPARFATYCAFAHLLVLPRLVMRSTSHLRIFLCGALVPIAPLFTMAIPAHFGVASMCGSQLAQLGILAECLWDHSLTVINICGSLTETSKLLAGNNGLDLNSTSVQFGGVSIYEHGTFVGDLSNGEQRAEQSGADKD
ncbi:hypothetical protein C8J57DRAFT_1550191 [Mycena rebaudengoi]|nr:hypothetical protein C8J57DRAFT_1550191 [Mycena rebaudengoi]